MWFRNLGSLGPSRQDLREHFDAEEGRWLPKHCTITLHCVVSYHVIDMLCWIVILQLTSFLCYILYDMFFFILLTYVAFDLRMPYCAIFII